LPLFINTDYVLQIWLRNAPDYTVAFTRLILLFSLIDAVFGPLWMSIQATGDIKRYQLVVSCFTFSNLPISYFSLRLGLSPVWVLIVRIIIHISALVWCLFHLKNKINLPLKEFSKEVFFPIFIVSLISISILFFPYFLFINLVRLIISCFSSVIVISSSVYFFGLSGDEKTFFRNWLKRKFPSVTKELF
jgi:hypothetical protein